MSEPTGFTPAEVARRVAALGVIVNPAVVWSYLRARYLEQRPDGAAALTDTLLPVSADDLDDWLDDFLDGVEATRAKLIRGMNSE